MAVATKKPQTKKTDNKAANQFVNGGLGRSGEGGRVVTTTVRFPKADSHLFDELQSIVADRQADYPKFSQNDLLLEAVREKIEREKSGG